MRPRLIVKLDFSIDVELYSIGVKRQPGSFRIIMAELNLITSAADFFKAYEPSIWRNGKLGLLSLVFYINTFRIMLSAIIKDILRAR